MNQHSDSFGNGLMEPPEVHGLTGAYALDALSAEEREAYEAHLAACMLCADEVHELRATAARLGAVDEITPPPAMRQNVLAAISRIRQIPPQVGTPVVPLSEDDEARPLATVTDLDGRRSRRTALVLGVAAAVLAVVAVGLGAQNAVLRSDRSDLRATNQASAAAFGDITSVLSSGDARTVSSAVAGDGTGTVVFSNTLDRAVFVGQGLATPSEDRTFQLWLITSDGTATSAGIFRPDDSGAATVALAGSLAGNATVGLSVEPAGGSSAPTTTPVLAVPLKA